MNVPGSYIVIRTRLTIEFAKVLIDHILLCFIGINLKLTFRNFDASN
jgi:hypothetical protein